MIVNTENSPANHTPRLPEHLQAAVASLRWVPLPPPPMQYKSLEEMRRQRTPPFDIEATIQTLTELATVSHKEKRYLARIVTALLLLGHGCVDEAHDLVLGLSWRGDLPYAYGPTINLEDDRIQTYACYAHCLVHRAEGPHASEFNMTGYQNSEFWAGLAMRDDPEAALPLEQIRQAVQALPTAPPNFVENATRGLFEAWDPRVLSKLFVENHENPTILEFARQAALVELKLVIQHLLHILGFTME